MTFLPATEATRNETKKQHYACTCVWNSMCPAFLWMMYELGITHLNGAAKSLSTPAPRVSVCVKMKAWRWVWVCNGVFCVHRCEYSDSVTMTTNGLVKVTAVCELKKKLFPPMFSPFDLLLRVVNISLFLEENSPSLSSSLIYLLFSTNFPTTLWIMPSRQYINLVHLNIPCLHINLIWFYFLSQLSPSTFENS